MSINVGPTDSLSNYDGNYNEMLTKHTDSALNHPSNPSSDYNETLTKHAGKILIPPGNPSNAQASPALTKEGIQWIIIPIIMFQSAGFIILLVIFGLFVFDIITPPDYVWLALIGAFAGMPFAFTINIKNMMNVVSDG